MRHIMDLMILYMDLEGLLSKPPEWLKARQIGKESKKTIRNAICRGQAMAAYIPPPGRSRLQTTADPLDPAAQFAAPIPPKNYGKQVASSLKWHKKAADKQAADQALGAMKDHSIQLA